MFRIRNAQMQAFELVAFPAFEDYMLEHLKSFADRHCAVLGDKAVRQVIRIGATKAKTYGFTRRGPTRLLIELMFILGGDFDVDPQLQWAARVLGESETDDQLERADRLYEASLEYHVNVIGANSIHAVQALRGIHRHADDVFALSGERLNDDILAYMSDIYPQKVAYVGEGVLRSLIESAKDLAKSVSAPSDRTIALFATSMFAFGYSFNCDPLFPWISKTIGDSTASDDPQQRIDRLFEKTKVYIEKMLDYLEQS